jgi:ABC-type xylose transport system permease subunit
MMPLLHKYGTLAATALVCAALFVTAGILYEGFMAPGVVAGFFTDNAFLGIAAIGVTFVILSGGIDLSVGAMIGCCSIMIAALVEQAGWHPAAAGLLVLSFGTLLGAVMGSLIHSFSLPPFIVTLAGMFFARGLGFVVNQEAIAIRHDFYQILDGLPALVFLAVLAAGIYLAHWTRFGRNVYAVQRGIGPAHGAPRGADEDRRVRSQRLLLGAGGGGLHAVHVLGQSDGGHDARARRHRRRRDRGNAAHRRRRLRGGHAAGRAHLRHHPDRYHL